MNYLKTTFIIITWLVQTFGLHLASLLPFNDYISVRGQKNLPTKAEQKKITSETFAIENKLKDSSETLRMCTEL